MKKILLLSVFCSLFMCLQAQEFKRIYSSLITFCRVTNMDELLDSRKAEAINDSIGEMIAKEIIAGNLPDSLKMNIEKENLKALEKLSFEEYSRLLSFSFIFYLDREGNIITVSFVYNSQTEYVPSDELLRETYNRLVKVKTDMNKYGIVMSENFNYWRVTYRPFWQIRFREKAIQKEREKKSNH